MRFKEQFCESKLFAAGLKKFIPFFFFLSYSAHLFIYCVGIIFVGLSNILEMLSVKMQVVAASTCGSVCCGVVA